MANACHACFGGVDLTFCKKSCGKRSLWKCGFSKSLVGNARFGSVDSHFWQKSRGKRSYIGSVERHFLQSLVENVAFGTFAVPCGCYVPICCDIGVCVVNFESLCVTRCAGGRLRQCLPDFKLLGSLQ